MRCRRPSSVTARPEVFNTDQGSQFTATAWTGELSTPRHPHLHGRQGPVDRQRVIERLWRSLKYECVYLQAFADFGEARDGIGAWVSYYNEQRPHSVFDGLTPAEVHAGVQRLDRAA